MPGRRPELGQEAFQGRGGTEGVHRDDRASAADIAFPAHRRSLLNGDASRDGVWQHLRPVARILLLEELPGRHADHADGDAFGREPLGGGDAKRDLTPSSDQDDLRAFSAQIDEHVNATR